MKKVISLVFALILLVCLGVPAFASYGYFCAGSWEELVEFLDELENSNEALRTCVRFFITQTFWETILLSRFNGCNINNFCIFHNILLIFYFNYIKSLK